MLTIRRLKSQRRALDNDLKDYAHHPLGGGLN